MYISDERWATFMLFDDKCFKLPIDLLFFFPTLLVMK